MEEIIRIDADNETGQLPIGTIRSTPKKMPVLSSMAALLRGAILKVEPSPHRKGLLAVVYFVHSRASPIEIRQVYTDKEFDPRGQNGYTVTSEQGCAGGANDVRNSDDSDDACCGPGFHVLQRLVGHTHAVTSVSWAPTDANILASGSQDGTVRVWDWQSGEMLHVITDDLGPVLEVRVAHFACWRKSCIPKSAMLVTAGADKTARFWQLWTCAGSPRSISVTRSASTDSAESVDAQVQLQSIGTVSFPVGVNSVDYQPRVAHLTSNPAPGLIAAGLSSRNGRATDETVQLIDAASSEIIASLSGHVGNVNCVRFSLRDRDVLASAGDDGNVILWQISGKTPLKFLHGHDRAVWHVCFAPRQPDLLASGSMDHSVRLWSVTTGQCKGVIDDFGAAVVGLAFSSKSSALVTGSFKGNPRQDWTLRLYPSIGGNKWTPSNHHDQPLRIREAVQTLLLVAARWQPAIRPSSTERGIPREILLLILGHLHVLDYGCKSRTALSPPQQPQRQKQAGTSTTGSCSIQ